MGCFSPPIRIDHELQVLVSKVTTINNIPRDWKGWERRVKESLEKADVEVIRLEDKKYSPDFISFCEEEIVFIECKLRKVPNAVGLLTNKIIFKILKDWKRKQQKQFCNLKSLVKRRKTPMCIYLGLYDDKSKQGRFIILNLEPCKNETSNS